MEGKALNKSKNKIQSNDHAVTNKRPDWKFKKKEFVKSTFATRQALLEEDLVSEFGNIIYIIYNTIQTEDLVSLETQYRQRGGSRGMTNTYVGVQKINHC